MDDFSIDRASAVPPSEQLRASIVARIASGELAGHAKLPTVRGLADQLGLAANTVAKAYRELEQDGFLETRGRAGTFVSPQGDPAERSAQAAAAEYAERVLRLGVDPEDAARLVTAALRDRGSGSDPASIDERILS